MAGVEPPAPPAPAPSAAVLGLAARGVRPRRVSAKRSWPPGCGRFPTPRPPPPPPPTVDDSRNKGVDGSAAQGGAEEVDVSAKRSWPPGCGRFPASPPPPPPLAGDDGEKGDDGERGVDGVTEDKAEEVVAPAVFSSTACNGALPHVPAQSDLERMVTEEEGGRETGEPQPSNDKDVWPSDGQGGIKVLDVMPLAVAAPLSRDAAVSNGSVENIGDVSGLLLMDRKGGKGDGELAINEVSSNGDGRELENRVGVGELERNEDVHDGGRKKRWLMSGLNPPPKRRAISAIRRFPPGCGRAAAALAGNGGEELPLEATPISVASGGAYMEDALTATPISARSAPLVPGLDHSSDAVDGKRIEDNVSNKVGNRIQEFQDTTDVALDDFEGAKNGSACPNDITTKPSPRHGFDERVNGKGSPRDKKLVARAVGYGKVTSKCEGRLQEGTLETRMRDLVDVKAKRKIIESDKMNGMLEDNAKSSRGAKNRKKTSSTQKGMVRLDVNMKQGNRLTESKSEKHAMTDQIEENDDLDRADRVIVQALMAPDNCPWTHGRKSIASVVQSRTPKSMLKKKDVMLRKALKDATRRKELSPDVASSKVIKHEAIEDKVDSYSEDEDNSKALVVHAGKIELCVTMPPCGPSGTDARSKVRKLLQRFQMISRKLMQLEEQHKHNISRIDIKAVNIIKQQYDGYTKLGPIVGSVPGVDVGDEFHFRVELSIVGLHRPYQAGIDTSKVNGTPIAISIVASGGYPDELSSSNELIYTGSGGKAIGRKASEDQKLERGNLALKNCIETKTPVRVIHGFKGQSRGEAGTSKPKQISTYIYDGLYTVVDCWQEGPKGSMVFKYKLQRNAGQPELALHIVKATRKSKVREGLCLPDISHGSERIPICVVNTIDDMQPAPFKYTTKIIYPHSYAKEPPKGCDCTNGCSDSNRCACAVKNGGEIPFNFNGAIVQAKALVYECGPSCRCPPTCHNRVSQHGIKIPLEIFKTGKRGWGVRSLSSISSGSFVCEYTGELLQNMEAEQTENDEYLFDIGHNYHVKELWEGLPSGIPSLESPTPETMEDTTGFTIDAAKCGNVGRFVNHSCSPNLYAQNVLWDHDDKKIPHIALFACENIPPLQELTYHYNYTVGKVKDKNDKEKVKHCFCGSSDCCGRLY